MPLETLKGNVARLPLRETPKSQLLDWVGSTVHDVVKLGRQIGSKNHEYHYVQAAVNDSKVKPCQL